jgi:hypothetical protein
VKLGLITDIHEYVEDLQCALVELDRQTVRVIAKPLNRRSGRRRSQSQGRIGCAHGPFFPPPKSPLMKLPTAFMKFSTWLTKLVGEFELVVCCELD